jgi:hypothetical protein
MGGIKSCLLKVIEELVPVAEEELMPINMVTIDGIVEGFESSEISLINVVCPDNV